MRIALALAILWLTIAVEIAWSQSLPQGALLLPIACGIMFWVGSGTVILLSATALAVLPPSITPTLQVGTPTVGRTGVASCW